MKTPDRNKHLRELATEVAGEVGRKLHEMNVIKKAWTPSCTRITSRRGHGHAGAGFSIPRWATVSTHYFIYYVIHEALHCFYFDHGKRMMEMERILMADYGISPGYQNEGAGPYVQKLLAGDSVVFEASFKGRYAKIVKMEKA